MFLLQPHLIEKSALTKKPTLVRGGKGGVFLLAGRALAGSLQNTSKDSRPPRRCPTLTAVVPWEATVALLVNLAGGLRLDAACKAIL